jgi:integrase
MAKPRTGSLVERKSGWFVILTVDVDGVATRKSFDLQTTVRAVAVRKRSRLAKQHPATPTMAALINASVQALETYAEAAARIRESRRAEGVRSVMHEELRDRLWIVPSIGNRDVRGIRPADIEQLLTDARAAGKSVGTLAHIRSAAHIVFDALWRAEIIEANPVAKVRLPRMKRDRRERAVLTDIELAAYLAWEHPDDRHKLAVLERQVMSVVSRCFGGLRTGDLHSLRWEQLDAGAFTFGTAPRKKTERPQLLQIPTVLRPFLADWWHRHGRPVSGVVFPALRGHGAGHAAKRGVSHAVAMRRDLQRAFAASRAADRHSALPAPGSPRWRELFEQTEVTKPVDFHSWRRAFVQGLANADINVQRAMVLTGHSDMSVHGHYLNNTLKAHTMPDKALPRLHRVNSSVAPAALRAAPEGANHTR